MSTDPPESAHRWRAMWIAVVALLTVAAVVVWLLGFVGASWVIAVAVGIGAAVVAVAIVGWASRDRFRGR
ncbi:hypothetical protein [Glaciibacter flavus]|uniref:hypothetical protein n=1 Tax=Orlajensenia flava TaxID=2565934 RepID=UPI003AFF6563